MVFSSLAAAQTSDGQISGYVRTLARFRRRAFELAGRAPWLAFLRRRCGLAMRSVPCSSQSVEIRQSPGWQAVFYKNEPSQIGFRYGDETDSGNANNAAISRYPISEALFRQWLASETPDGRDRLANHRQNRKAPQFIDPAIRSEGLVVAKCLAAAVFSRTSGRTPGVRADLRQTDQRSPIWLFAPEFAESRLVGSISDSRDDSYNAAALTVQ